MLSSSNRKIVLLEIIIPITLLVLGVWQGLLQTLMRSGIISDTAFGLEYYQGLTLHGVVNAIVLTTFFGVAFGNVVMEYYLKRTLNPTVNWLSFGMMLVGTLLAAFAILTGQANVLYTFYAPMVAHWTFYVGATLLIIGSWVAFFNWIAPLNAWSKENPGQKKPLAVLGMMATFIIWFIATLPVAVDVLFLQLPQALGIAPTINVSFSRVLFWFFGHPLVYFWLLPAYVMYYVMLPKLAGGKLYSDFAGRVVFFLFVLFSIPVGLHHQYTEPGYERSFKLLHGIFTFMVAIPSLLTAFTVAASLEHGARKRGSQGLVSWMFNQPFFSANNWLFAYLIVGLIIFILGGIGGVVNASYNINKVVHNTSWIPGHFHLTVGGPVLLAILGMSLFLMSQLTGKEVRYKGLAVAVPWLWFFGMHFMSLGQKWEGILGAPRRTNMGLSYLNPDSPLFNADWVLPAHMVAIGGILLFTTALIYFFVFYSTLAAPATRSAHLELPTSEALHDEPAGWVDKLKIWVIVAVVIIAVAYVLPIKQSFDNTAHQTPPYKPENPVPVQIETGQ